MEDTGNRTSGNEEIFGDWSKEESEELALIYLEDYFRTMDDSFLKEALQIIKDEYLDFQKIMHRARVRMV